MREFIKSIFRREIKRNITMEEHILQCPACYTITVADPTGKCRHCGYEFYPEVSK